MWEAIDATVTIRPERRARIAGSTSSVPRTTPKKFTADLPLGDSRRLLVERPDPHHPGVVDQHVDPRHQRQPGLVGAVGRDVDDAADAAERRRQLHHRRVEVTEQQRVPATGQLPGERLTDATGSTRDRDNSH